MSARNKVNLALDEIIKMEQPARRGARQAGRGRGVGNRRFQSRQGFKNFTTSPSKIGRGGRIGKRGVSSAIRMRSGVNNRLNTNRAMLNPSTRKLVEELALKTVNRVLAARVPAVAASRRGGRANRIASVLSRQRLLARQKPVRVIEEVVDDEEEEEDEYEDEEDLAGTSAVTVQQLRRALPVQGVRKQVIVKRVPVRQVQPIKKRVVVQRVVARQAPARIQLQNNGFQRRVQQNNKINAPRGRAMDVKNNKMFSALFGGSRPKEERISAGGSFLDRLPNIQRRGRGFTSKFNNDY